jgi:hypothetical protein
MKVAFSKSMTLAEFLDWEEQQPLRYEFDGFQPVAMTGGTAAHADIKAVHARDRDRGSSRRILRRPRPWHPRECQSNWAHRLWAPFRITPDEALEVPFAFLI